MSRYYGHVLITFTDGTTERVGGNRDRIQDDLLVIFTTDTTYGSTKDTHKYPLINIREWYWEDK